MTLFDLHSQFAIKLETSYSLKSELAFQTYATKGSIIISTAIVTSACVVLKARPQFIFFQRCPLEPTRRSTLLSKISEIISSDVTVLRDEHLYHILVYGSNVYNKAIVIVTPLYLHFV